MRIKVEIEAFSKAERIYRIFKSSEIIEGEPFELVVTFENLGEKFYGGSCELVFKEPDRDIRLGRIDVPPIDLGGKKNLKLPLITLPSSGAWGFHFLEQRYQTADKEIKQGRFLETSSGTPLDRLGHIIFPIASKEEIYQKYSLVIALVALIISIIALLSTVVDILMRFFF